MSSILVASALFVLGALLSSFITVISERVNTGSSWVRGTSACNSCGVHLKLWDMVPILSWVVSRGQCHVCKARIPWIYSLGEFLLGVAFVMAHFYTGLTIALVPLLCAIATLFFIVVYDLRHTIVPTISSALLTIFSGIYAYLSAFNGTDFLLSLSVAAVIGSIFLLIHVFSKGRAMGGGDAPVVFALSLLVGATQAIAGVLFSFWIGALVGIAILVTRPKGHRIGIEVPFVPFLAAGYALAFFTGWNPLLIAI